MEMVKNILKMILFEGEYLDNKRYNGKGFNLFGNPEFEINKGNGNIKEYDYSGDLLFDGEYLNCEKKVKNIIVALYI